MYEPQYLAHTHNRSRRGRGNAASCMLAALFLLLLAAAAAAISFVLFKPKDPKIAVTAVQFPKFSVSNGTFSLTFFQFVSVTNPNRDSFTHYDSSLQLLYSGAQVGVVAIPAGEIAAGRTQRMSAKFDVEEYPVAGGGGGGGAVEAVSEGGGGAAAAATMEIETRMKLVGRVRVLKLFMHKVESGVRCSVGIRVSDGSVLGLRC